MKNYIKHKLTSTYLFLGILSSSAMAVNSTPYAIPKNHPPLPIIQPQNSYTLEASLKIRSLTKTAQDSLQLYREIGATPQQIAAPYMFLSLLGHPNYPALSPEKNICIFIYSSPTDLPRKYVFLAKLQNSNLKTIIENFGWGAEEYQGWALFTPCKADFQIIKDKQHLINYANQSITTDIEFKAQPTIVSSTKLKNDKELNNVLANLHESTWQIDLGNGQITFEGLLIHKEHGQNLGSWFEKHGNRWGANSKVLHQKPKESKVNISLERKEIGTFFNQLKAKVLSLDAT